MVTWAYMNCTRVLAELHLQGISKASAKTSGTRESVNSLISRTDHVGVTTMKRLDQGHLHPKLEDPGLTCPGRELNPGLHGGKQSLRKEPIEQFINSYLEHLPTYERTTSGECSQQICENLWDCAAEEVGLTYTFGERIFADCLPSHVCKSW